MSCASVRQMKRDGSWQRALFAQQLALAPLRSATNVPHLNLKPIARERPARPLHAPLQRLQNATNAACAYTVRGILLGGFKFRCPDKMRFEFSLNSNSNFRSVGRTWGCCGCCGVCGWLAAETVQGVLSSAASAPHRSLLHFSLLRH